MKQDYKNTKRPVHEMDSESKENFSGYPKYPASEDIYSQFTEEAEIDPENPAHLKELDETLGAWNEKTFSEDLVGDDLDVPGSETEQDVEQENNVLEDEENSYYSIGGDSHNELEENQGD